MQEAALMSDYYGSSGDTRRHDRRDEYDRAVRRFKSNPTRLHLEALQKAADDLKEVSYFSAISIDEEVGKLVASHLIAA